PRVCPQPKKAILNDKVEKLGATVAQQQKQIGQQQKQIESLIVQLREQAETFTAQLKEQASQIQKVSAQLALEQTRTANRAERSVAQPNRVDLRALRLTALRD